MPYITLDDRYELITLESAAESPGDLNFLFTHWITQYLKTQGLSYQTINDVMGALEGAKMEFYRRVAAPYEDGAKDRNGDVY